MTEYLVCIFKNQMWIIVSSQKLDGTHSFNLTPTVYYMARNDEHR